MVCFLFVEPQVRSIVGQIRPDRQSMPPPPLSDRLHLISHYISPVLLFSATFKKSVEQLAFELLDHPIRIIVGNIGEVCTGLCYFYSKLIFSHC